MWDRPRLPFRGEVARRRCAGGRAGRKGGCGPRRECLGRWAAARAPVSADRGIVKAVGSGGIAGTVVAFGVRPRVTEGCQLFDDFHIQPRVSTRPLASHSSRWDLR